MNKKVDIAVTKDVTGHHLFVREETNVTKELEEAKAIRNAIGGQATHGRAMRHLAHFPAAAITAYLQARNLTAGEFDENKRYHIQQMMADPNLQAFVINPYFTKK